MKGIRLVRIPAVNGYFRNVRSRHLIQEYRIDTLSGVGDKPGCERRCPPSEKFITKLWTRRGVDDRRWPWLPLIQVGVCRASGAGFKAPGQARVLREACGKSLLGAAPAN